MVKPTLAAADSDARPRQSEEEDYDDGDDDDYAPHIHVRIARGDISVELSASYELDVVTSAALKLFEQIEPKT